MAHAARFARTCYQIEQDTASADFKDSRYVELEAHVVAGVLLSVASLEANLNELLVDNPRFGCELTDAAFDCVWDNLEKKPTLEKTQAILLLCGKEKMGEGDTCYQNAAALLKLRNHFVHFRPSSSNELTPPSNVLRGRFTPNRFFGKSEELVPQGCMSHSCLEWAVRTSGEFTVQFVSLTGLTARAFSKSNLDFATR